MESLLMLYPEDSMGHHGEEGVKRNVTPWNPPGRSVTLCTGILGLESLLMFYAEDSMGHHGEEGVKWSVTPCNAPGRSGTLAVIFV